MGAAREFNVAADVGLSQTDADCVRCGDLLDAGRCDGYAEACADESHEGEPLGRLLHDAGAEAVLFAERDGLFVGELASGGREEDEGLVAQICSRDDSAAGERMIGGQNGDEGFGEDGFHVERLRWIAVAEEACVERAVDEAQHHDGGEGLV